MHVGDSGLERDFLNAVPEAFAFLEREYDMKLSVSESLGVGAGHARFEGPASAVDLWHDPRAEIDVYVSESADDRIGLTTLLTYVGAPDVTRFGGIYSSSEEDVIDVLRRLADGLRAHGGPWLRGESAAFEALRSYLRVESGLATQRYTREARPGTMQHRLERAFRAREWGKLIRLIESLPEPHSAAEELALAYARLRVAEGE